MFYVIICLFLFGLFMGLTTFLANVQFWFENRRDRRRITISTKDQKTFHGSFRAGWIFLDGRKLAFSKITHLTVLNDRTEVKFRGGASYTGTTSQLDGEISISIPDVGMLEFKLADISSFWRLA
jgi:hypothetical protein